MKVSELLVQRQEQWKELDRACNRLESTWSRKRGAEMVRFAALYRAACADLALADAYQLPVGTVRYLHQLIGRAHSRLYSTSTFRVSTWLHEAFFSLPQRLFRDWALRLAFVLFWAPFLGSLWGAYVSPEFAERVLGKQQMIALDAMYHDAPQGRDSNLNQQMGGFYIFNNAGIGLQCFAGGMLLGVGGIIITLTNGIILGTSFGYMATTPERPHFYEFVMAHGPFELTAIVLAAGAGLRLGFSMIDTGVWTRGDSLRRAGREALPAACISVILFCLAAFIEGFISPSALPYSIKAGVAVVSAALLCFYFIVLGLPAREPDDVR